MKRIRPFKLERYFAKHEFSTRFLLCASDCQSYPLRRLWELDLEARHGFDNLWLGYTPVQGKAELRREICHLYPGLDEENILVHAGAQEAIYAFIMAVLEPGDHLIALTPCYQSLRSLGEDAGLNVTPWPLVEEDHRWRLAIDDLEGLIQNSTRVVVVNFPHNPTGLVPSPADFLRLIAICRQHGLMLLSDEVYRGLELFGHSALPPAATLYENGVSLGGLSKAYGLPGLRIGWLATHNKRVIDSVCSYKDYLSICNSAPSEALATLAMKHRDKLIENSRGLIERNLTIADDFFDRHRDFFAWHRPDGGPIALVRLRQGDADIFCDKVRTHAETLLMPGSVYDVGSRHVRFGFGREDFGEALAAVEEVWERLV